MTDAERFEAQLKAHGYPEIRFNEYKPSQHNPEHSHPFDVHALVLQGEITLTVDGRATAEVACFTTLYRRGVLAACSACARNRPCAQ
jgi:hypothetical protein